MFTCMLGHYYGAATVILLINPQTFHRMLTESVDSCRDKECPFSGITNNQFWESFGGTVLESSAQRVHLVVSLSHQDYSVPQNRSSFNLKFVFNLDICAFDFSTLQSRA